MINNKLTAHREQMVLESFDKYLNGDRSRPVLRCLMTSFGVPSEITNRTPMAGLKAFAATVCEVVASNDGETADLMRLVNGDIGYTGFLSRDVGVNAQWLWEHYSGAHVSQKVDEPVIETEPHTYEPVVETTEPQDTKEPKTMATITGTSNQDAAALVAQAFEMLTATQAAPVDETMVREMVERAVKDATRAVSVTVDNREPVRIDNAHAQFETLLKVSSASIGGRRMNILLTGPAGSGKTTAAKQLADALSLDFYSSAAVQNVYQLTGFVDANSEYRETAFRTAYENGGVFILDEMDASDAKALVAFNQALANGCYQFPDGMIERHKDFVCIAAANTFGTGATTQYVGRSRLDAATLDRFVVIEWSYDEKLERALAGNDQWVDTVQRVRQEAAKRDWQVIISPRASIDGAALLATGLDRKTVANMVLGRGVSGDMRDKLLAMV